jgi:sulfur-carrier protein
VAVTVKIPTQLRPAAEGVSEAQLEGATVQEVLDSLFERFGELRGRISDEDGSLRRFVNVYLGGEDIRFLEGLQTPVVDGAELTILPAVAGGEG